LFRRVLEGGTAVADLRMRECAMRSIGLLSIVRTATSPGALVVPMNLEDTMTDWLPLIRAEYHEIPGLHLTKIQFQRLWNLDQATCEAVLDVLETSRFLRRTRAGAYVRADA